MKHVARISKQVPAVACIEDHPNIISSALDFLKDPIEVIRIHLIWLIEGNDAE